VQGYAGTGKTFMMRAASELALRRGIELIGLAPSSSAARTLEQETNISSHTLSRFLVQYNIVLQKLVNPKRIDLLKERFKNKLIILDEASLISSKQMYDFSRITNILNIRVVLSGDIKQCNAIEAGNPFEQFQKAGMKTARMKKIIRQTNMTLQEVVKDAAKGNIEEAYNKSVIEEIPGKNRVLAAQAIGTWESKSIEERKNTIITVTSRELRKMCNEGIRDILKREGVLTETPKLISILQSRDLTLAQMEHAKSYRRGDVILFNKDFSDFNIRRGQYYNVFKVKEDNILVLKQKFFSKYVKADLIAKDKGAIEVYHREDFELQKGDTIRWTRNNFSKWHE
jgi:ATP-dependent exoDNAse (exonuclease V) alpha subunit